MVSLSCVALLGARRKEVSKGEEEFGCLEARYLGGHPKPDERRWF